MTVVLGQMASADQLDWLACIKYSSLQFDFGQFSKAVNTWVPCSELGCRLTSVSLPACNLQHCMHALRQLQQPHFWLQQ